jgi:hypothetical protein
MVIPAEAHYSLIGQALEGAQQSQMFGKPCFKIKGKAFISFFNGTMVFKLTGDAHAEALALDGAVRFDPSGKGRPMKEWVQLPYAYEDRWADFAAAALAYVAAGV